MSLELSGELASRSGAAKLEVQTGRRDTGLQLNSMFYPQQGHPSRDETHLADDRND